MLSENALQECPTRMSYECPTRTRYSVPRPRQESPHNCLANVRQECSLQRALPGCPSSVSYNSIHKGVPQECPTTLCYKSVPAKVLPVAHEPTQLSQLTVEVSVIVIITNITTIIMAVIITNIHLHTWLWEGGSAK